MVTTSNRSHRPGGSTIATVTKVQSTGSVLLQVGVGRATHLTGDILHHVLAQQTLNVLRHVLSTNDQALVTIDGPFGSELGHEKGVDVIRTALHHGADLLEVDPQGLLAAHELKLRRLDVTLLLLHQRGVVGLQEIDNLVQELIVRVLGLSIILVLHHFLGLVLLCQQGLLTIQVSAFSSGGFAAVALGFLGLFLFLLLLGEVQHGRNIGLFFVRHGS
mmetsp:Transcript_121122/g.337359  ORF Transcript_121122/g.337359 Transcript_121122/m.337359 type:complete len:218 (+) Transcript_121122:91-744(+)